MMEVARDMELGGSTPAGEAKDLSFISLGKRGASLEGRPGSSAVAVRYRRGDFRGKLSLSQVHRKGRADGAFARQIIILREPRPI